MTFLEKLMTWFYGPVLDEGQWEDARILLVSRLIPEGLAWGQAVGNIIFLSSRYFESIDDADETFLRHEYAHVKQWRKYGALEFLIRYYSEALTLWIKHGSIEEVHRRHSMEIEADDYAHEHWW